MYNGWLAIGTGNPTLGGPYREIVNNSRAYAYADYGGLCWLLECLDCPETQTVVPGGPDFRSPKDDPAPWYDVDDPDSWGFYGVVGLGVDGAEGSTMTTTVVNALTGGGVIGPAYNGPRTLVVRALAIASDECSLQFGLNWIREVCLIQPPACGAEMLTFFDCCPCVCDDPTPGGPCWAVTYHELDTGPTLCEVSWWPTTYTELMTGPPAGTGEEWCAWPDRYHELDTGPASWTCCVDYCVAPYVRQYNNARITEGPNVIRHPVMLSHGAMCEFEIIIVTADPDEHGGLSRRALFNTVDPVPIVDDPPPPPPPPDPFAVPGLTTALATLARPRIVIGAPPVVEAWFRDEITLEPDPQGHVLRGVTPTISLRAFDTQAEQVRVGVWLGTQRVAGWSIPFIPAQTAVIIDAATRTVSATTPTGTRVLNGFVRDWSGGAATFPRLTHGGTYRVTVDQDREAHTRLLVDVGTAPVSSLR